MVAAESGEARASRLRALAAERQAQADSCAALAEAVEKGNHGERVVADLLDVLDGAGWCVLHDRYKPGSPANLDHVVVGPPGLFVIDAKNWKPAPLRFDERGMSVRGYRRDVELHGAAVCAELVKQRAVGACPDLAATGVLAFVQDMGLRTPVEHHGVRVLQSADLLAWLTSQEVELDPATVRRVGATLDAALPPRAGPAKPFTIDEITARGVALSRPASGARVPGPARRTRDVARVPHGGRRRARRNRGSLPGLVVGLVAVVVFVFLLVPMVLKGIPDRISEATRPHSSSAPAAPAAVPPAQVPTRPSG